MNHGFVKVAAAVPHVQVADCFYNIAQIEKMMRKAADKGVQIIVFPELSITGYTCMDLFQQDILLTNTQKALSQLVENTSDLPLLAFIGAPLRTEDKIVNAAIAIQSGKIIGIVPKTYLTSSEKRWFTSANDVGNCIIEGNGELYPVLDHLLITCDHVSVGVEIGSDLWAPVPPSSDLAMYGANIIVNLSASKELIGKHSYRKQLVAQQSARTHCGYIYSSCGFGESSTDLVFSGSAMIAENGQLLAESERFSLDEQLVISDIDVDYLRHDRLVDTSFSESKIPEDAENSLETNFDLAEYRKEKANMLSRTIDPHPFIPEGVQLRERCEEILHIQTLGLAKRILHAHAKTAVVGISGGLDSTLALLVSVMTFDLLKIPRNRIIGITMPGFGTTGRTYHNSVNLIHSLGVTFREISIKDACMEHFRNIHHDPNQHDVTYENSQARERTQILMDVANKENGMVIGTGDLSELALGWATYNGDHMSMYGVNGNIPKTLVKYLVEWIAYNKVDKDSKETLLDIIDTPISPELIPADEQGNIKQKTEDLVGPYELHDFYLYHFLRYGATPAKIYYLAQQAFQGSYSNEIIKKWLYTFFRRFFQQQFKRSCLPDGPKVGSVGLSPRGDWSMPSDAMSTLWLQEIENL